MPRINMWPVIPRVARHSNAWSRHTMLLLVACTTALPLRAADPKGTYLGPSSCASSSCHGAPGPVAGSTVLRNEYDTWLHAPAPTHIKAWDVLLEARSRDIIRKLGLATPAEKTPLCLSCHSMDLPRDRKGGPMELTDGISCEGCHGPAGGWRSEHSRAGWTHEQSVAAGMIDLRNLETRAAVCLSCHQGDSTKRVDHRLLAAGHPLLNFELDNYTESRLLPAHWRSGGGRETHGAHAWAVGQAIAFRRGLDQIIASTASSDGWPEFSAMECRSCHHSLAEGELRDPQLASARPGLPTWSGAQWIVFRYLVTLSGEPSMDADVDALAKSVRLMQDRKDVAARARALQQKVDEVRLRLNRESWSESKVRSLMKSIAADRPTLARADRATAEQVAFAFVTLRSELIRQGHTEASGPLSVSIDNLFTVVDRAGRPDELDKQAFLDAMTEIDRQLR